MAIGNEQLTVEIAGSIFNYSISNDLFHVEHSWANRLRLGLANAASASAGWLRW
jgi:hypothetical protein